MCHCPHLSDVLQHSDLVNVNRGVRDYHFRLLLFLSLWWRPSEDCQLWPKRKAHNQQHSDRLWHSKVNEWYLGAQELPRKDFLMITSSVTWTANTRLIGSIDLCCWTQNWDSCDKPMFLVSDYSCPISLNFSLLKPCISPGWYVWYVW